MNGRQYRILDDELPLARKRLTEVIYALDSAEGKREQRVLERMADALRQEIADLAKELAAEERELSKPLG